MANEMRIACITDEVPWFWDAFVAEAQKQADAKQKTLVVDVFQQFEIEFLRDYCFLWVNPNFSHLILPNVSTLPEPIRASMVLDCFVSDGRKLYPRNLFVDALHDALVLEIRNLDIRMGAYVTGCDSWAKAAMVVLIRMGYSKLFMCDENHDCVKRVVAELKTRYLGIQLEEIESDHLTSVTEPGSILINCAHFGMDPIFQVNVLYLNYLVDSSVIVDWGQPEEKSALMEEGGRAQLRTLSGQRLWEFYFKRLSQALEKC